jgi:ribosomal protein S18 acetylase RimI-like enzyme
VIITGPIPAQPVSEGLRPVHLRQDLAAIADLIEVCFGPTLDAAGRAAIREMRMLSRSGPVLWALNRVNTPAAGLMQGFVWIEEGRLVGNVSVSRAGYGKGVIIANVAVLPEYRRRGIARQLMQAALDLVVQKDTFAVLQVEADNTGARALYRQLGFADQRTFTRWRRSAQRPLPFRPHERLPLARLTAAHTDALYTLALRVRPNTQSGMGWLRPTRRTDFQTGLWDDLRQFATGRSLQRWVLPGPDGTLDAALLAERRMGGLTTLFDLLVRPECRGDLEVDLVHHAIHRLGGQYRPLLTDHPADDEAASTALHAQGFKPERTLSHMIWFPPKTRAAPTNTI